MKYLVALLNSTLIAFWLRHKGKMQGNNYQIDKEPLLALPIIKPSEEEQKEIIDIVNKILSLTHSNTGIPAYGEKDTDENVCATIKEYERQIDQLVYKLYGLREEEIEIIEDFNRGKSR